MEGSLLYSSIHAESEKVKAWYTFTMEKGKLIIGAMPIGNEEDFTLRLLRWLKDCDLLVVESENMTIDFLNTSKIDYNKNYVILTEIPTPEEKAKKEISKKIIFEYLNSGKNVLFICDEGTPAINDPGNGIFSLAYDLGHKIDVLPGPSVVTTAFIHAFCMDDNFTGYGFTFLQPQFEMNVFKNTLEHQKNINTALVLTIETNTFFDLDMAKVLLDNLGNRSVAICDSMTTSYEKIIKTDLVNVGSFITDRRYRTLVVFPKLLVGSTGLEPVTDGL